MQQSHFRGCDHCEEWYHGDCIGVTEKEAKFIKKFYCIECREKNKHLKVVYKRKYADKIKERSDKEHKKDKKERRKEKKKKKDNDKDREWDKDKDRDRDRSHKSKDEERHNSKHKEKDRESEKDKVKKDPEKTKHKDQMIDKIKEEKTKDDSYKIKKIKEEDDKPKRLNPPLPKRVQEVKRERSKSVEKKDSDEKPRKALAVTDVENIKRVSDSDDEPQALQVRLLATAAKPVKDKVPAGVKRKASRDVRETAKKRKAWRPAKDESDESDVEADLTVRQCHGIDCINTARMSSKYCSDQCGLSLASLRIYQMLPERIREWNLTSCKAAETNQKELVRIRAEINTAKVKLEEVDREVETLEQLIAKVKTIAPIEKVGDSSDEEDEDVKGGVVNCVSCGKDVSSKLAIRHMETCFNKFESKTSYGSLYKTNIEGYEMVCDFYNAQQGNDCSLIVKR